MTLTQSVMKQLTEIRKAKKISQESIAIKMLTNQPNISRMETGIQHSSLEKIKEYADILGVELDINIKDKGV